jgi:hypothetical protein
LRYVCRVGRVTQKKIKLQKTENRKEDFITNMVLLSISYYYLV